MPQKHFELTISGHVQGVGFRYSALQKAKQHKVTGFVKNLLNGNVYIEVEGDEENVNEFIKWCYEGPSYSRVFNVDYKEKPLKGYNSFKIIH